jgi:hydroxymethylglutaryl-CoA reductase (NADPH)
MESTVSAKIPRSNDNDYSPEIIAERQRFIEEKSANQCSVYSYVTNTGDLYYSITLPAMIMATFGGGTSLATQRECLEMMDSYGAGKACKLLEIAAGMVVAGELSLVSAARTDKKTGKNEWVDAHEKLGRNR